MFSAGFSTAAVDTSSVRSSEQLTAFMSEIGASDPIDQYFQIHPALDYIRSNSKVKNGGRQIVYPVNVGGGVNFKYFSGYDEFNTSGTNTARPVVYPYINAGSSVVISWEEEREVAGSGHAMIDLLKHKRMVCVEDCLDKMSADLFVAAPAADELNSLAKLIDSSGTVGELDPSIYTSWVSTETASGSFATRGITDMTTMLNTLKKNKAQTDKILTHQDVHEVYEKDAIPDVRFDMKDQDNINRGAAGVSFKKVKVDWDPDCNSGVMYFMDSRHLFLCVDSEGNFAFDPFQDMPKQKAKAAKWVFRGNLVCTSRRAQGKLTGITA